MRPPTGIYLHSILFFAVAIRVEHAGDLGMYKNLAQFSHPTQIALSDNSPVFHSLLTEPLLFLLSPSVLLGQEEVCTAIRALLDMIQILRLADRTWLIQVHMTEILPHLQLNAIQ